MSGEAAMFARLDRRLVDTAGVGVPGFAPAFLAFTAARALHWLLSVAPLQLHLERLGMVLGLPLGHELLALR
eukprot:6139255-Heterocapsa_arctica.AAC.1